ncbi:MAG: glycosyltransferase family 2 protein [Anaeromyxobacter sp.]
MPPLVSVITPAYNAERFIGQAIASVRAQSMPDWEMVVADDGSTDGTIGIVQELAARDPRITLLRMPRNGGPGPARTAAIERARGRFLAFLDADDLWDGDKLELQVAFMREHGHAFAYTGYRVIGEDGRELGRAGPFPATIGYREMLVEQPGCLTVMLDRERLGEIRFPPFRRNQDGAMWLLLMRRDGIVARGLERDLASYRAVRTSITANKLKSARAVWTVYREQEHLPVAVAAGYFVRYALRGLRKHLATRARQS